MRLASPAAACSRSDGERLLDGGGVAAGADALDAVDLLALQRRVDAEELDLALAALGEVVDADEDARRGSRTPAGACRRRRRSRAAGSRA